jgi:eukaryotic-like serine/threonine-protein kinase
MSRRSAKTRKTKPHATPTAPLLASTEPPLPPTDPYSAPWYSGSVKSYRSESSITPSDEAWFDQVHAKVHADATAHRAAGLGVTLPSPKHNDSAPLQPGSVVGNRWRLVRRLGAGGMGEVWEAEHVINGKRAAVKTMQPYLAEDANARQEFLREGLVDNVVQGRARLPLPTGPGTINVYDSGTVGGRADDAPYMAMELLEGSPLDKVAKAQPGRRLHPLAVAQIMDEVLHTLEAAHSGLVVHRDLKPANLFITDTGDVKVLDFGLAKVGEEADHPSHFVGTMGYAPPEQVIGLADPRSDLYALGATARELLSGKRDGLPSSNEHAGLAYMSDLNPVTYQRLKKGDFKAADLDYSRFPGCPTPPTLSVAPTTPPHIAAVVDRALACSPEDRYPSAAAMRADLRQAMEEARIGR